MSSTNSRIKDPSEIRALIIDNWDCSGITPAQTESGVNFRTQDGGTIFLADEVLDYYYEAFNTNIQKFSKYELYHEQIDGMISDYSADELSKEINSLSDWFNYSEFRGGNFSPVAQWISNDKISKEQLKQLYSAYTNSDGSTLDEQLQRVYHVTMKKTMIYYKILINVFYIYDKKIFNRKD